MPGFGQVTPFELPFTSAVKTGTTTGFRDNWTLGYTANFAVGVWVGNADGSAMRDVSGDGAGPIWRDVMLATASTRARAWPARPPAIVEATVCSPIGLLPGPDCPSPVRELFVAGSVPRQVELYYVRQPDGELAIAPLPAARAWALDADCRWPASSGRSKRTAFGLSRRPAAAPSTWPPSLRPRR